MAPAAVAAAVQDALLEDANGSGQPAGRHQCSILVTLQHVGLQYLQWPNVLAIIMNANLAGREAHLPALVTHPNLAGGAHKEHLGPG